VARGRPCGPLVDIMSIIGKKWHFIAAGQKPGFACLYTRSQFCVDPALGPVRRSFATYSTRRVDVAADAPVGALNNIHAAGCAAPDR